MAMNIGNAAAAYANAMKSAGAPGLEARDKAGGGFAELLKDASQDAIGTLQKAETLSVKAASKEADLLDVVTAVNNADATLQTVVAVRDRVIQAYQDIIRMPI